MHPRQASETSFVEELKDVSTHGLSKINFFKRFFLG